MLATTIDGSLPKPPWLAKPGRLWAPWRLPPETLAEGQRDAGLLALRDQEEAGIDIVTGGEQSRQHFVHGFLEKIEGVDFGRRVTIGIRSDRYQAERRKRKGPPRARRGRARPASMPRAGRPDALHAPSQPDTAMEYERAQGRQVYDVHEKNPGYDVTSLDLNSGELRLIEVKGLSGATGRIRLTPNERQVAEDRRDCYWLYIVTNCGSSEVDALAQPMRLREPELPPYGGRPEG